jgi:methyltransferase (TIGR00027 family)
LSQPKPLIRNISDTARWVAVYRARETEREDAIFRDPFARRLAGERGDGIARSLPDVTSNDWPWTARTWLFDHFISSQVHAGADMVVNLAAGLDARPYRMDLPPSLQWVEVDLPGILEYKEEILKDARPVCSLERVALDLSDAGARRALFERLGRQARKTLIVSEGLLIYLSADEVGSLAADLAAQPSFRHWTFDLTSPGLLRMLERRWGKHLSGAGARFKFAPEEGPGFFARYGWRPVDVRSMMKTAAHLKRLPWLLRLIALLPDSKGSQGARPWSAVVLTERT